MSYIHMKKMNIHQIKQNVFNNWIFGENSRERNRAEHFQGLTFDQRSALVTLTMPDQSRIWGVDISIWNTPPVNLKRMVDEFGMSFVIIKACDGSVNSRYYFEHVAEAKRAGIPWGSYNWLYASKNVSIDAQVNAWVARYNIDPPPMGISIDAETTRYGGVVSNPNGNDLRAAHDRVKARSGRAATTYTAKYFADTYLKGFDFTREELWVANYGVNNPLLPNGATSYTIHQFTATLDGKQLDPADHTNAELDGNYYHDANLFRQRFGGTTTPPTKPPPTNGGSTVTTYYLECKNDPTDTFANADGTGKIGKYSKGTKLTSYSRNGVTYKVGSVYVKYAHVTLLSTVEEPTTPPPPDTDPEPPPPAGTTVINLEYHIENNELIKIVKDGVTIWSKP